MSTAPQPTTPNVKQVVPFFRIADMERSLRFYMDGLGFTMKYRWIPEDKIRWCWLELGGAALMLQEYKKEGPHSLANKGTLGLGVSLCFQCQDALALYHDYVAKGLAPSEPFVGNNMWVTHLDDPDGYRVEFESLTDVPEETKLSDLKS
jgi:lactoylglutathione lyase